LAELSRDHHVEERAGMQDIKSYVRAFITDNFFLGSEAARFHDADSLVERHIVDSTGFLELVTFIEETYAVRVEDEEMGPENLGSLDNIEAFIRKKKVS
jgi:acyl carrier protein